MDLFYDVRASLRGFRRRPFHPLVAVTILTLGLAATVAVFTYFTSFSQSFPGANPAGLVRVFGVTDDDPYQNLSYLDFVDYADQLERRCRTVPGAHLHLGYVSEDVLRTFYGDTVEDVEAWLDGKPIRVLNPEALA